MVRDEALGAASDVTTSVIRHRVGRRCPNFTMRKLLGCFVFFAASAALGQERKPDGSQPPSAHRLVIQPVADAAWGARVRDVEKVLYSAADELWRYFPERKLDPILVEPKGGPVTLYRRGSKGEYLVRLNTGKRLWAQHAFQFAHEFGHILANYDEYDHRNRWFEESICEMASLFVLRRMAETWKTRPPYPNWRDYSPALLQYAADRMRKAQLPRGKTLGQWYRENEAALCRNACCREKNTLVAVALLPLFEEQPQRWEVITWLNDGRPRKKEKFAEFLAAWKALAPEKHRQTVEQIADAFAIEVPPTDLRADPRRNRRERD